MSKYHINMKPKSKLNSSSSSCGWQKNFINRSGNLFQIMIRHFDENKFDADDDFFLHYSCSLDSFFSTMLYVVGLFCACHEHRQFTSCWYRALSNQYSAHSTCIRSLTIVFHLLTDHLFFLHYEQSEDSRLQSSLLNYCRKRPWEILFPVVSNQVFLRFHFHSHCFYQTKSFSCWELERERERQTQKNDNNINLAMASAVLLNEKSHEWNFAFLRCCWCKTRSSASSLIIIILIKKISCFQHKFIHKHFELIHLFPSKRTMLVGVVGE